MRTHLSLPTGDLDAAVQFYEALLQQPPSRRFAQYVQFLTPTLNLALTQGEAGSAAPSAIGHYGLEVDSAEGVARATACLTAAGVSSDIEDAAYCCHSLQQKVWARDPDGRRWEVFWVSHRDEAETRAGESACCS